MLGNNPTCQRNTEVGTKIEPSDQYGETEEISDQITIMMKRKLQHSPNEVRSVKFAKEADSEADDNPEYYDNYKRNLIWFLVSPHPTNTSSLQ